MRSVLFIYLYINLWFSQKVRAIDNGVPSKAQTTRVGISIVNVPKESPHAPKIKAASQTVKVTESDKAGFLISLIQATDEDNDTLWYNIIGMFRTTLFVL